VSERKANRAPRYEGLVPASAKASRSARGSSRKSGTGCEVVLRKELRKLGLRFAINVASLPGCPDIVFRRDRLVVFCDGDFWHGRHLQQRLGKLARGHNSQYWIAKIQANVERDRRNMRTLRATGWRVLRLWESDISRAPAAIAATIAHGLVARRPTG
jgi:DNA mismatch endonuclease, patch repair protein